MRVFSGRNVNELFQIAVMNFRDAHMITGKLVAVAKLSSPIKKNFSSESLTLEIVVNHSVG